MSGPPGYPSPEAQKEMQERGMFDHSQQNQQQHAMPQQAHMQQGHPQQFMQHQGSFNQQQGLDPMVHQMQQQGAFYQNAMLADCARGNHTLCVNLTGIHLLHKSLDIDMKSSSFTQ